MIESLCCALWLSAADPPGERLLTCHFNDRLVGEDGEQPAVSDGIRFGRGRVGTRGLVVSKDTRLSYPAVGNLDIHEGTFCLWIKPTGWLSGTDRETRDILFMKATPSLKRNLFGFGKNRHYSVCFTVTDGEGKHWQVYVKPSEVFGGNQWTHIAIAWRLHTGVLRLYVNGVCRRSLDGGQAIVLDKTPAAFFVGNRGAFPIDATIDELVVYARCLTDAQALAEYRKPIMAYYSATAQGR